MKKILFVVLLLLVAGSFAVWFVIDWDSFEPYPAQRRLVEANNGFAVDFYQQIAQEYSKGDDSIPKQSFCFSPYSIATLTQALKAATRGETDQEIAKTLRLTSFSDEDLYGAYGLLQESLSRDEEEELELLIANRIWIQKEDESRLLPEFKERIQEECFFGIEAIDFKEGEKSAKRVNAWVSDQTKSLIPTIVDSDDFGDLTSLLAVNAVYFKGEWVDPFGTRMTKPRMFYDSDGETKLGDVPMMSQCQVLCEIGKADGLVIFRKSYKGGASFVVLLPDPGKDALEKLEGSLSAEKLQDWLACLDKQSMDYVLLPKFELKNEFTLNPLMRRLGIEKMFNSGEADFSGMIQQEGSEPSFFVDRMYHKAIIKVNEIGTEAAAVTAAAIMLCDDGDPPPRFVAERPFLFLIVDDETSSILFMGRYMGPGTTEGPRLHNLYKPHRGPLPLPDGDGDGS